MKNTLASLIIIIGSLMVFQVFSAENPCADDENLKSPEFAAYCSNLKSCTSVYGPTNKSSSIIKTEQIPFVPARTWTGAGTEEKDPVNIYKEHLTRLGVNINDLKLGGFGLSGGNMGVGSLEQASYVYVETQNAIYNCAVLQTKLKVTNNILNYVKSGDSSNIKTKMESQVNNIKTELEKRKCNSAPASKDESYKQILLTGITYNYCNYRFYLDYLSEFPQNNASAPSVSSQAVNPWEDKMRYVDLAKNINKQGDVISKEVRHAKQVYNQSFSAFAEFENTYGLHIMLLFIQDDYILMKKNLSSLLSPISQLAYKIPQAQKK